jgi:predicted small integral membrane protein
MASVCVWAGLVGINNVFDYRANFQFVQHMLEMDTTSPGNPLLWRSLPWAPCSTLPTFASSPWSCQ